MNPLTTHSAFLSMLLFSLMACNDVSFEANNHQLSPDPQNAATPERPSAEFPTHNSQDANPVVSDVPVPKTPIAPPTNTPDPSGVDKGKADPETPPPAPPVNPVVEPTPEGGSLNLLWQWPCEQTVMALALKDDDPARPIDVKGSGQHNIAAQPGQQLNLSIRGELCHDRYLPRHVVIVVDASSSMAGNDPIVETRGQRSCGRLNAVKALLDNLNKNGAAQVGILTFASGIEASSQKLLSVEELRRSYLNVATLCADRNLTNYTDALLAAEKMLKSDTNQQVSREIYFLSDGEPTAKSGQEEAVAKRLQQDTMIGTIMLQGDDTIMKNKIASKDPKGNPRHVKVDDAGKLAEELENLSTVVVTSAYMEFEGANGGPQTKVSLAVNEKIFNLETRQIHLNDYKGKFSTSFVFTTNQGQTVRRDGTLVWQK